MKIIAFTGMPASGKSEAVVIAKDKGIPVIRMGDLVWEETQRQGKPLDDKNVGTVAEDMRKKHGMDIWARRTVEKISSLKQAPLLVIDGVRNMEEIDYFKKRGINARSAGVCKK
jgi:dephospho-CoA kinase